MSIKSMFHSNVKTSKTSSDKSQGSKSTRKFPKIDPLYFVQSDAYYYNSWLASGFGPSDIWFL